MQSPVTTRGHTLDIDKDFCICFLVVTRRNNWKLLLIEVLLKHGFAASSYYRCLICDNYIFYFAYISWKKYVLFSFTRRKFFQFLGSSVVGLTLFFTFSFILFACIFIGFICIKNYFVNFVFVKVVGNNLVKFFTPVLRNYLRRFWNNSIHKNWTFENNSITNWLCVRVLV